MHPWLYAKTDCRLENRSKFGFLVSLGTQLVLDDDFSSVVLILFYVTQANCSVTEFAASYDQRSAECVNCNQKG